MAKKKKSIDVQKFGGVDNLGTVKKDGHDHELSNIEAKSQTHLESDQGHGNPVIIRCFEFAMNPEVIKHAQPTKQQLFNSHYKGIEMALWKDGFKVFPDVHPRVVIDEVAMRYKIFVGARIAKGNILNVNPKTLTEIVHG
jgi:hypothetical protein